MLRPLAASGAVPHAIQGTTAMPSKPDFRAIIAGAKRKYEERRRADAHQRTTGATADEEQIDAGIRWLKVALLPLLTEASTVLAGEKIELVVHPSFDVHGTPYLPDIGFQCLGPQRAGRWGLSGRPHSDKYWIRCDGESFEVGIGGDPASAPQRFDPKVKLSDKRVDERLNDAICACIQSYYDNLDSGG